MKRILSIIAISMLFGCEKKANNQYLEILEKKFDYTKIELENFVFVENNMSDRDFCNLMIDRERSRKSCEPIDKYMDSLMIFKGKAKYKEVLFFKLKNTDTIHKGFLYFNEKEKLIKSYFVK
jgi:hypothetical protein